MHQTTPPLQVPRRQLLAGTAGAVIGATAAAATSAVHLTAASAGDGELQPGRAREGLSNINPPTLAAPRGYSHVVVASGTRTIYVSGQVPLDRDGNLVGAGDLRAQTRQVFENIKTALAAAGASFGNVAKLTYFVTDASQVQIVRDVRDTFIDPAHPPASTLVEVRRLVRKEFLIEIEAIAST
jgi:enamine deaminase RidA (YjgF/YER057c/UK114 family)